MKCQELQIGDYALVKPSMMLIKVAAIHHKKVGYHAVTHKLNWVRMYLIEPIPLTPEILEKNKIECVYTFTDTTTKGSGLIKQIKHSSKKQDFYIIVNFYFYRGNVKNVTNKSISIERSNPNKDGINYVHSCEVEYVHELQHALRLCGLNDLADKFKLED